MKICYRLHDGIVRTLFLNEIMNRAVIGCDSSCEIVLPYQDITPNHAMLIWEKGRVFAMHPESVCVTNPLSVDGMRLGSERLEVYLGSELSIGNCFFAKACLPDQAEDEVFAGERSYDKPLQTSVKRNDDCLNQPPHSQADEEYQAQLRALQKLQNNVMLIYGPPPVWNDVNPKHGMAVDGMTQISPDGHKNKS